MSGGSYDYICFRIEDLLTDKMYDDTLNEMVSDFVSVVHDLEWWQSGDISEEDYRDTVDKFKKKWLKNSI